jgi:hypothetical protein
MVIKVHDYASQILLKIPWIVNVGNTLNLLFWSFNNFFNVGLGGFVACRACPWHGQYLFIKGY